jgi:23S rRNA (pseudouridine1915-N3)-methyltransferase
MRVTILAVGRMKAGPIRDLFGQLQKRMSFPVSVREIEEKANLSPERLREREGDRLLAALPEGAKTVVLDERGKMLSSTELAAALARWRNSGDRDFTFVIGGAEGLSHAVRARADLLLALGPMTWPHQLVRVLLLEQLFRVQSIWSGHPYHRG